MEDGCGADGHTPIGEDITPDAFRALCYVAASAFTGLTGEVALEVGVGGAAQLVDDERILDVCVGVRESAADVGA